ncbi:unnamed protein product [Heligmosomoides polygyrus]|uniref:Uncharacterized protein n=1 Tax=Heligmosomoides polygyrus TaxID=6339 RepID=A0A183F2K0_HELPZ|nr:unnamed protein product [Heligmosomoides polygyrus]
MCLWLMVPFILAVLCYISIVNCGCGEKEAEKIAKKAAMQQQLQQQQQYQKQQKTVGGLPASFPCPGVGVVLETMVDVSYDGGFDDMHRSASNEVSNTMEDTTRP